MKFYMCEFKHKRTKRKLYKFGITKHMDVMKRFSVAESRRFGRSPTQYNDFEIRVLASYVCEDGSHARILEQHFLKKYPKNGLNVELVLNEQLGKYSDMSGITELRQLTPSQLRKARSSIYNMIEVSGQKEHKDKKRKYLMDGHMYD